MTTVRKPEVGDTVSVFNYSFDKEIAGTVIDLLNIQFTYLTKHGLHFCKYTDGWKLIEPHAP